MSTEKTIEAATMCFACGPDNPIGLRIDFTVDGDRCTGKFTPTENHVGFEDTVHGGIIFSCLDDTMANILYHQKRKAHTAKCEIRYRQALQVGKPVILSGWIENERRRLIVLKSEIRLEEDDSIVAEAEASFMIA